MSSALLVASITSTNLTQRCENAEVEIKMKMIEIESAMTSIDKYDKTANITASKPLLVILEAFRQWSFYLITPLNSDEVVQVKVKHDE